MNDGEALRVLGLPPRSDVTTIRRVFATQLREFREARDRATDPVLQARLDRALELTLRARNQLLMTETRSFAITQELPAIRTGDGIAWRSGLALLTTGVAMLALGLLWPIGPGASDSAATSSLSTASSRPAGEAAGSHAAAERVTPGAGSATAGSGAGPERGWLDPVRIALGRSWIPVDGRPPSGPTRIPRAANPQAGWQLRAQMHGGFALLGGSGSGRGSDPGHAANGAPESAAAATGWLLAMPARVDGELVWGCFTSAGDAGRSVRERSIPGCLAVPNSILHEAVLAGSAGPFEVAMALQDAGLTDRLGVAGWLAQALEQGDGRAAQRAGARLLDAAAQSGPRGSPADAANRAEALAMFTRADALFAAADDRQGRTEALAAMARIAALEPGIAPERASRHMLDCRALQVPADGPSRCPTPGQLGHALEGVAASADDWARVRWWYQQAFVERERSGAEGLARLHALGRLGGADPERALSTLEDAAQHWEEFGAEELALAAARIASIWRNGWGVEANAAQEAWWSAQAARRGHAAEAVQLAAAFALGAGTGRDAERARDVVELFGRVTPLFEVAFLRRVGERLEQGAGVDADPEAAHAWLRRAFERCRELADAGDPDAQLELAGMYFEGVGTEPDVRRAAALYEALIDPAPRAAVDGPSQAVAASLKTSAPSQNAPDVSPAARPVPLKALNMLAWIRATHPDPSLRDGTTALRHARAVVAQAPLADYHDTLAAAFAEAGDFDAALAAQQRALALLAAEADPVLAGRDVAARRQDFNERLARFEQGRPWREGS